MYTQKRTRAIPCMVYMYNPQKYYKKFVQIPKKPNFPPWKWHRFLKQLHGGGILAPLFLIGYYIFSTGTTNRPAVYS